MAELRCGRHILDLSRPRVMGILNVTPDSFSDGGAYQALSDALARVSAMVEDHLLIPNLSSGGGRHVLQVLRLRL